MRARIYVVLLGMTVAAGCATKHHPVPAEATDQRPDERPPEQASESTEAPIAIASSCAGLPNDPVALRIVGVEGNLLHMYAQYSGGCQDHDFYACWDGTFMESFPVQVRLQVFHDAHGDTCEALITKDIYLDLSTLRESYQNAYRSQTGTIILRVAGAQQDATYRF